KNGNCPSGVTGAVVSHSIWTRPANVSATADHSSTSGCAPIGWAIRSFRSVPIPTQSADSASQHNPPNAGFRFNAWCRTLSCVELSDVYLRTVAGEDIEPPPDFKPVASDPNDPKSRS